mgnify:CR=1 FL=1
MTNEELDKAVAEAQGWSEDWLDESKGLGLWIKSLGGESIGMGTYHPSTNWQQAGELLEKYKIDLSFDGEDCLAEISGNYFAYADTPQRAICLAVLAAEGVEI